MNDPALLERLAERIVQRPRPHPLRVAIDGVTAAGKTTLADELVAPLCARGRPVIRAAVDSFHRPRAERYRRGADAPQGYYYDAFDYPALRRALLLPLGPGGDRRYRLSTLDLATELATLHPGPPSVPGPGPTADTGGRDRETLKPTSSDVGDPQLRQDRKPDVVGLINAMKGVAQ